MWWGKSTTVPVSIICPIGIGRLLLSIPTRLFVCKPEKIGVDVQWRMGIQRRTLDFSTDVQWIVRHFSLCQWHLCRFLVCFTFMIQWFKTSPRTRLLSLPGWHYRPLPSLPWRQVTHGDGSRQCDEKWCMENTWELPREIPEEIGCFYGYLIWLSWFIWIYDIYIYIYIYK